MYKQTSSQINIMAIWLDFLVVLPLNCVFIGPFKRLSLLLILVYILQQNVLKAAAY